MRRAVLVLSVVSILSGTGGAQSPAPPRSADWTGYYTLARGRDLEGLTPVGSNLHELVVSHLQPWAKLKMEATDPVAEDTGQTCQPTGLFRYPAEVGNFLWLPSHDKVLIVWQRVTTAGVQRVYMNRTHPRSLLPTWNGDSIGRWDGDTLVIDTTGFNEKSWLTAIMAPHSEEARLTQRIRRVKEGRLLEMTWTVEDRVALTSAYTYSRYYKPVAAPMPEDDCNDDPLTWFELRNERLRQLTERAKELR